MEFLEKVKDAFKDPKTVKTFGAVVGGLLGAVVGNLVSNSLAKPFDLDTDAPVMEPPGVDVK